MLCHSTFLWLCCWEVMLSFDILAAVLLGSDAVSFDILAAVLLGSDAVI